ncbi:MAG: sigma 54-interacting transcriptional regulator, partial [Nitrospirae bacterium]|nr:sigma 54-interacting transcriptional regulator [Nitrospirota bacterium]
MSTQPDRHPVPNPDNDGNLLDTILLGNSKEILEAKRIISHVAKTDVTVLLRGESGTGK